MVEEEAQPQEAKLRLGLVELPQQDKGIMVDQKQSQLLPDAAAAEQARLGHLPMEMAEETAGMGHHILALLMPVEAEEEGLEHLIQTRALGDLEAEEMEEREMQLQPKDQMDRQILEEEEAVVVVTDLITNLVALEVAELLLSAMQSNGSFC